MKLSEAIRLGAMQRPQLFFELTDHQGGTCAMGSAILAGGLMDEWFTTGPAKIVQTWPLLDLYVNPPGCSYREPLWYAIVHLNNNEKWTREQIADWVETLEAKERPTASEVEELVTA